MDNNFCKDCGGSLIINNERPCTCLGKQTPEERIKEIAGLAWRGAANAFRMYPNNKHTFSNYWESAKNQFKEFEQSQPTKEQIVEALRSAAKLSMTPDGAVITDHYDLQAEAILKLFK